MNGVTALAIVFSIGFISIGLQDIYKIELKQKQIELEIKQTELDILDVKYNCNIIESNTKVIP